MLGNIVKWVCYCPYIIQISPTPGYVIITLLIFILLWLKANHLAIFKGLYSEQEYGD